MNIYFDTEFTELTKDGVLISIGLISDSGKEFYAEIDSDYINYVDDWITENVLANTVQWRKCKHM